MTDTPNEAPQPAPIEPIPQPPAPQHDDEQLFGLQGFSIGES